MPTTMNTQPSPVADREELGRGRCRCRSRRWRRRTAYRPGKLEGGRHAQGTGAASARPIGRAGNVVPALAAVDRHHDREAGAEQPWQRARPRQPDPHRHALHDLGEVAGSVLGRQQAEGRARGRCQALDRARRAADPGRRRPRAGRSSPTCIPAELGLLEVRFDIELVQGDDGHQLLADLQIVADLDPLVADDAVDGCLQGRMPEVDPGKLQRGLRHGTLGLRRGARRIDDRDLVAGGLERGLGGSDGGPGPVGIDPRLAQRLLAGVAALGEPAVALEVALGPARLGGSAGQRGLGLTDAGGLHLQLALRRGDRRLLAAQGGRRLVHPGPEIPIVQAQEHLAAPHRPVLHGLDAGDIARDPGRDDREVALDIGVVGGLQKAQLGPPVPPAGTGTGQQEQEEGQAQALLHCHPGDDRPDAEPSTSLRTIDGVSLLSS